MKRVMDNARRTGYTGYQLMDQLFDEIIQSTDIDEATKIRLGLKFSMMDKCLTDGCDEHLQIMRIFC